MNKIIAKSANPIKSANNRQLHLENTNFSQSEPDKLGIYWLGQPGNRPKTGGFDTANSLITAYFVV